MWTAKGVISKETSGRENFGFIEGVADFSVDGKGRKAVFGTDGLMIFRNVEN